MNHLSLENLARLLDEEPSRSESEHLAECADCRSELAALRADRDALNALPDLLPPPPTAWPDLAERLKEEGLIRTEVTGGTQVTPARTGGRRFLYLAASLALFLLGGSTGYLLRGADSGGEIAHGVGGQTTSPGSASTGGGLAARGEEPAGVDPTPVYRSLSSPSDRLALGNDAAAASRARLTELFEDRTPIPAPAKAGGNADGVEPVRGARRARHLGGAEVVALEPGLAHYFAGATGGVLVLHVEPGTTAARSGLVPGDVITTAAGGEVQTVDALWNALSRAPAGAVSLTVIRQGDRLELQWRR